MAIIVEHAEWITEGVYKHFGQAIEAEGYVVLPEGLSPPSDSDVWMMIRQSLPDISEKSEGNYYCQLEADILIHLPNPDKAGGNFLLSSRLVGFVQSLFDCITILKADGSVLGFLNLDADFPNNPNTYNWGSDPVTGITRVAVAGNYDMWFQE